MNTKIDRIITLTEKVEETARKEGFEHLDDMVATELDTTLDRLQVRRTSLMQGEIHQVTHLLASQEKISEYAHKAQEKNKELYEILMLLPTLYKMTIDLIVSSNASTNFASFYENVAPSKRINNLLYGYGFPIPKSSRKTTA